MQEFASLSIFAKTLWEEGASKCFSRGGAVMISDWCVGGWLGFV